MPRAPSGRPADRDTFAHGSADAGRWPVVRIAFYVVTGLIYVAIVGLWACVLIPIWLRRHVDDQAARIERHQTAMGALARVHGSAPSPAATASRRRRVWLGILGFVALVAVTGWVLEFVPLPGVAASVGLLVAFCLGILVARRSSARHAAADGRMSAQDAAPLGELVRLRGRTARGRHAATWTAARSEAAVDDAYRRTA